MLRIRHMTQVQEMGKCKQKKSIKGKREKPLQKVATLINIEAVFEANKSFHNQFCR